MLSDRKPPPSRQGFACSVDTLLQTLKGKELAAFEGMLASPAWGHEAIWQACKEEGYRVSQQSVGKHRRQKCRCFR